MEGEEHCLDNSEVWLLLTERAKRASGDVKSNDHAKIVRYMNNVFLDGENLI
jgi:hypothetical protein